MAPALFSLEKVSVRYDEVQALNEITCLIHEGEHVAVVGHSGSGKSTLLKVLAGTRSPTVGAVFFRGEDASRIAPCKRGVGFLFQGSAHLLPHLSGTDHIQLVCASRRGDVAHAFAFAERLGISGVLGRTPGQLSGGQRQRLGLLVALAANPGVAFLDEPFSSLDRSLHLSMRREFSSLFRELGKTLVLVTHDIDDATRMCDRVLVVMGGEIIQDGRPSDLYGNPVSLDVARVGGEINIISPRHAEVLGVTVPTGTKSVGIRPEHLVPDSRGVPGVVSGITMSGGVVEFCFTGLADMSLVLSVRFLGAPLFACSQVSISLSERAAPLFFGGVGERIRP